ncbi:GIY-YIG nuclease family protein [Roseivirga sp. E12]|uniref:GIY-YIG nuclease family protein n=1 Tax=Roseivirga sp. E12 TaxID=2819237 RepID=UPI001ABCB075|nr:GIY-YIG nuclease family protein [Roseivirga sp. E12]MBO3696989.1 GIY-YIG nuclease family protein [Roseivirga sp. E12]
MKYYIYILKSEKDGSFYIGYSHNPEERLVKHNNSNRGYTSTKKPWKLVYTETFGHKSAAIQRERFLKRQKSAEFLRKLINQK